MDKDNTEKVLNLVNNILNNQDYTNIEKAILTLLYLYNDKIDVYRLHKMVFLASLDIEELRDELEPRPIMYKDIFYDENIAEALESLQFDGLIEGDFTFLLSNKGKEVASHFLLSDKEKDIYKEIVDLFKDTTDDEILAIFYFKLYDQIKIIKPLKRIESNRKKLAISLYKKGKISIGAASEIAGVDIAKLLKLLKKRIYSLKNY
jgi:predicted HTH domain antitoxin